jgi:hypothetical protein
MVVGAPNMFQPTSVLQQPRRISSRSSGGLSAAAAAVVDLPPHVAPMIITEAIKHKQLCSISFEDISSKNACVTTCGLVFTNHSMKEWLKQKSTCPECRKRCRISGEPAAPLSARHPQRAMPREVPEPSGLAPIAEAVERRGGGAAVGGGAVHTPVSPHQFTITLRSATSAINFYFIDACCAAQLLLLHAVREDSGMSKKLSSA